MNQDFVNSSKFFSRNEYACKCGCNQGFMNSNLTNLLDQLRHYYNKPIYLSSAYRCNNHSAERTKPRPGKHNEGIAVDIKCHGKEALKIMKLALEIGFTVIGVRQN